jgi:hypothetical protein
MRAWPRRASRARLREHSQVRDTMSQEDKRWAMRLSRYDWELDELESMKTLSLGSFPPIAADRHECQAHRA